MKVRFSQLLFATLVAAQPAFAANEALVTAVFSNVSNGYERQRQPDGTFKREYYALANGQYARGAHADPSIDNVPFTTVTNLITPYLAKQNYYMAENARSADLLLVISWGTTIPFDDAGGAAGSLDRTLSAMNGAVSANRTAQANADTQQNQQNVKAETAAVAEAANNEFESQVVELQSFNTARMKANERTARLLGYVGEINDRNNASRFAGAGSQYDDLVADIEEPRYYVIVSAYDFRAATQKGERKLLWSTRVSIRAQGNRFDERLATMLARAGSHFGEGTNRLLRQYQSGTVKMDDLKFIESVPAQPKAEPPREK